MKRKRILHYCPKCKENSTVWKIYTTKKGNTGRVAFCINDGCGWRQDLNFFNNLKGGE